MSVIAITDYIDNPDIEQSVLGNLVGNNLGNETEVLLVWHKTIDVKFIDKLPNLRGVQRYGVGYDNLDLNVLKERGIIACNNPDYGVDEVSDTAVAMILYIARGVSLYNHSAKKYFDSWQENVNKKLKRNSETVIGIIGAGRIGGSVILKCHALKFQTFFFDKYKERGYEKLISSQRVDSLEELLELSDIVSIHVPLTAETKGMVDHSFLKKMKEGSSLVNTARGGLFSNLDDIHDALMKNHLYSFATDVLPQEPPINGKLIDAWRNSEDWLEGRVTINPHTSYYSRQSIVELRQKAAQNALRIFNRELPHNLLF